MPQEVYTAEMATDELGAQLVEYGFDPAIIVAIISALLQLLSNKRQNAAAIQDCCKRKSLLTRVQLRRALANQGVPFGQRDNAVRAALEVGAAAEVQKVAAFAQAAFDVSN